MTILKTMKGQAEGAGMLAVDWPSGGPVAFACLFDNDSGAALGAGADTLIYETVSGVADSGTGFSIVTNNADGTNNLSIAVSEVIFAGTGNLSGDSFISMYVGDLTASSTTFKLGALTGHRLANSTTATTAQEFVDSTNSIGANGSLVASATGQMLINIVDRENKLISTYAGINGDNLVASKSIVAGLFDFGGKLDVVSYNNSDGIVIIRCKNGIPNNWLAMMQEIAAALRTGTNDGASYSPPARRNWMVNIASKYLT